MILSKYVTVSINSSNIKHYSKYVMARIGDNIQIDINNLTKYSRAKILVKCDVCGLEREILYKDYTVYGYSNDEYLCRSCKMKKNNIKKWGVENVFQLESTKNKIKETNLEKYGVEYISQSDIIKNKIKETNLEKYGYVHHFKNKDILNKQINTNLEKYGVVNVSKLSDVKIKKIETCLLNNGYEYIFYDSTFKKCLKKNNLEKYGVEYSLQSDIIKDKIKETNIEKYGVDNPSKNEKIKEKIKKSVLNTLHKNILLNNKNIIDIDSNNRTFKIYCESCKTDFIIGYFLYYKRRETNTCICTNCNLVDKHQSGLEILLQKFIEDNYSGSILYNYRLENKELDIYLPDLNLAFEFNGIYWHSEIYKSKNYHKVKTDICRRNNIQLMHIWEDDWLFKTEIVKSMILNKLHKNNKIWARSCVIKEIADNKLIQNFLNNNHIQGYVGSNIKLGLYFNDKLVSLMCFKKNKNEYELNRFCNLINTSIVGSASKLFNYFIKKYTYNKIITFSNNSYSDGLLYEKLNFTKICELKPDYHYVVDGIRIHKFNFRKKDTSDIYRIYDAGKIKYIYI